MSLPSPIRVRCILTAILLAYAPAAIAADSAFVRVNQAGYEKGGSARAYLMSTAFEPSATFAVVNSKGVTKFSGSVGALLGTWSHNKSVFYQVYALDFTVPGGDVYQIQVSGPVPASSPNFAVDSPENLYSGLLLNSLFFNQTERDGKNFVPERAAHGSRTCERRQRQRVSGAPAG